jgi:ABC-2 type transport system permease protein
VNATTGTGQLVRLAFRRDRVMAPVWIAVFVLMAASTASATIGFYPTVQSRVQAAAAANGTTSLVALYGRVYDPTSLGELAMWKMGGLGAALVAVLAIVLVVRHTRAEEESGRLEMLGATVVGRYAALTAALLVVAGVSVALGLLTAVALVGTGLPAAGSLAFGLAWAGVGIAMGSVAAVSAQLTRSARAATGLATAILGAVYLLRAIGDTAGRGGPHWLSWLSPIGWSQQFRPYAGSRWWVLLITLGFAAAVTAGAYALVARRDLDSGLLPDRPGPAVAAAGLRNPLALAWRLHRGSLLGWAAGFAVLGLALGNIAANVGEFITTPQAREMITRLGGQQGLTNAFLATELGFAGIIASAYGIQAALRLRAEEVALHAEPLLATPVGRIRWACSHLAMALGGVAVLLVVGGLGAGASWAVQSHDAGQFGPVLAGALVQVPAAWVLTAVVLVAFGLAPRLVAVGWAALVAFLLLGELGPLLKLDRWVMDLSPFGHVPRVPGSAVSAPPLLWLLAVVLALAAVGLAGFRRRDVG